MFEHNGWTEQVAERTLTFTAVAKTSTKWRLISLPPYRATKAATGYYVISIH
jgi:hypothetical protein